MNLTDDERDLIALHLVTGVGPRLTAAMLEHFGSASAVLRASVSELVEVPYLGPKVAESLTRALANPNVAKECASIVEHGVHLRVRGRDDYPVNLATIDDAPHFSSGELDPQRMIATSAARPHVLRPAARERIDTTSRLPADRSRASTALTAHAAP